MKYHNGAKTFKMSARIKRSSASDIAIPVIAKPFKASKKKKRKDLSNSEQLQVTKHEIRGNRFTYRLRSVKDILKAVCDEDNVEDGNSAGSPKKAKSKAIGRQRKSILDTVLVKNFELSIPEEKIEEDSIKQEEIKNVEASKGSSENSGTETDGNHNSRNVKSDGASSFEKIPEKNNVNIQKNETHIKLPAETASNEVSRKEAEQIERILAEKSKWLELHETYKEYLADAKLKLETDSSSQDEVEILSEEHQALLNGSIDAQKFTDRLQSHQTEYMHHAQRLQDFIKRMQDFKEHATEVLRSSVAADILTPGESSTFETPRRLISKIIQGVPE